MFKPVFRGEVMPILAVDAHDLRKQPCGDLVVDCAGPVGDLLGGNRLVPLLPDGDNFIADEHLLLEAMDEGEGEDAYYLDIDDHTGMVKRDAGDGKVTRILSRGGNILAAGEDPFVDSHSGDFRIVPGSTAASIGFEPIPFGEIGPR